jgi:hypothetical protein
MRGSKSLKALRLIGAAVLVVMSVTRHDTVAAQRPIPGLVDLGNVSMLREQFNKDRGAVRLVLLLSPT